jgi:signal transduction histidine kinase
VTELSVIAIALAAAWAIAALVALRTAEQRPLASYCALLAVVHAGAATWAPLTPLALFGWLGYALASPNGELTSRPRQALFGGGALVAVAWTGALITSSGAHRHPSTVSEVSVGGVVAALGIGAAALRCRRASAEARRSLQWLAAAAILAAGADAVIVTLWLIVEQPHDPLPWLVAMLGLVPIGQVVASASRSVRAPATALTESIAIAGVAVLVAVVYLVVVAGIDGAPKGHERDVLLSSLAAAIAVALLALPVRNWLLGLATTLVGTRARSAEEVATTFSARMSRAVPMDELMLQLAESLRASVASAGVEIWTGASGTLSRAVSVPDRGSARLRLGERELVVISQARIGGHGWSTVWLPAVLDPAGTDLRVVPIAHLGELLGIIVVRRAADAAPFTDADETALVELARQLGLALHNVRLDSALQASLAELADRNVELQASRLRIVTASDASRRAIERNLHDGAQQHLVALAVKLGLAQQIIEDGDIETVQGLLGELRADVQVTITELRDLAHGIYPPLLRDRGLGEALRTAATRSVLPCTVAVDLPGRFPEEVETAAYFCCLEAMQNAGKYAGAGATLRVAVGYDDDHLCVELNDDGAGFAVSATALGHGFVNMQDRLGAINGELSVESSPGSGTTVRASIPVQPRAAAVLTAAHT